jgi:hypothetical protein
VWPQHSAYLFGLFRPNSDRWSNGISLRGHLADLDVDRRRNLVEQITMHKSRLDYVHRGSTRCRSPSSFLSRRNWRLRWGYLAGFKFFRGDWRNAVGMATLARGFEMDLATTCGNLEN